MLASDQKIQLLIESSRTACQMLGKVNLPAIVPDPTGKDPSVILLVSMWRSLATDIYAQLEAEALDTTVFLDPGTPGGGSPKSINAPLAPAGGQAAAAIGNAAQSINQAAGQAAAAFGNAAQSINQAVAQALQQLLPGMLQQMLGSMPVTGTVTPTVVNPATTPATPTK